MEWTELRTDPSVSRGPFTPDSATLLTFNCIFQMFPFYFWSLSLLHFSCFQVGVQEMKVSVRHTGHTEL